MGIEKVVEKLEHIVPLSSLLTRSATGQAITTYFNLISGPRRDGEAEAADARRVEPPPAVPTPDQTAVVLPPEDDTLLS